MNPWSVSQESLERFAALVAALEQPEQEPVVVRPEVLDLISEAAEVLDKVRVSCDAWEKYGLRDFLPDELAGTAGMLRDGLAFTHPPRREWVSLPACEDKPHAVLVEGYGYVDVRAVRAIEAALKAKNTQPTT